MASKREQILENIKDESERTNALIVERIHCQAVKAYHNNSAADPATWPMGSMMQPFIRPDSPKKDKYGQSNAFARTQKLVSPMKASNLSKKTSTGSPVSGMGMGKN